MAPEVLANRPADVLSDQFSFCVTLWEALFGARPYPGKTIAELLQCFDEGAVLEPPAGRTAPPRLRRIALRGLAIDPAQRYPSMEALVAELAARSWFSARNVAIVATVAITAGGAGAVLSRGALQLAPKCSLDVAAVDAKWSSQTQAELSRAFVAAAPTYGAATWSRTQARVDAYLERWKETATAVCERDWTTAEARSLRELEAACLGRAQTRVEGVIEGLAGGERVRDAIGLVSELPDVTRCTDASTLLAAVPSDPAARQDTERIRDGIAAAFTELGDARHEDAAARLQALADEAKALDFPPVVAEVGVAWAHLDLVAGRPAQSRTRAREAFDAALLGDAVRTALGAVLILAQAGVADRHLVDEGLAWIKTGESLLARLGPDRHLEGRLAMARASLAITKGESEAATEALEQAVTRLDDDDPELVKAHGNWGTLLLQEGRPLDAVARYEQALAAAERNLGPDHPDVATWLLGLGSASMTLGDFEKAETYLRRSLKIHLDTVGEGHPNAIQTRMYLGVLSHNKTEFDEAIDQYRRALASAEKHLGKTHPLVAEICLRFGDTLSLAGKHDEAEPIVEKAREIYEEMLPAGDAGLAPVYTTALVAAARAGRLSAAVDYGRRGLELSRGDDDPTTVNLLHETARAMLQAGRQKEAVELLQRAALSLTEHVHDPRRRALVEFELAMALYPNDHARGRLHAESALEVQPADVASEEREQITRWLAEHP
jgi:tetratricopeptide (TPR) repeat protein